MTSAEIEERLARLEQRASNAERFAQLAAQLRVVRALADGISWEMTQLDPRGATRDPTRIRPASQELKGRLNVAIDDDWHARNGTDTIGRKPGLAEEWDGERD